jgi:hypothetical protein
MLAITTADVNVIWFVTCIVTAVLAHRIGRDS